jgi:hypothetical protein
LTHERIGLVIIKNFVRKDNGDCSFTFEVDNEETQILLEFAIRTLINMNLVNVEEAQVFQDAFDFFDDGTDGGTLQ